MYKWKMHVMASMQMNARGGSTMPGVFCFSAAWPARTSLPLWKRSSALTRIRGRMQSDCFIAFCNFFCHFS